MSKYFCLIKKKKKTSALAKGVKKVIVGESSHGVKPDIL